MLRVWLPLTKDLRQQGLSDCTVEEITNPVFDSNGKLGKALSEGKIRIPASKVGDIFNNNTMTIAFWYNNNTSDTSGNHAICGFAGNGGEGDADAVRIWDFFNYSIPTQFHWSMGTLGGGSLANAFPANTWVHVCVTWSAPTLKIYLDGVLKYTGSGSSNYTFNKSYYISFGHTPQKLNDFRIYDHCLSPMEVKELSKGLVLHYPLNRGGWGQENLLINSANKASSGYNVSNFNCSANNVVTEWGCTDAFRCTGSGGTSSVIGTLGTGQSSDSSLKYSYSLWVKNNHSTNKIAFSVNHGGQYSEWLDPGQAKRIFVEGASGNGTSYIQFNWRTQIVGDAFDFSYWHPKIEIGDKVTPWCPNSSDALATAMGLNGTTEYDCSGYCNNGIKNNLPTYSSDTAKYTVSTHVDGVNQTIQLPNLLTLIPDSIFTFNIWFKRLASEPSSKAWETILGGPSGFEIETCSANNVHDNKIKAYSWGGGMFEFELDKWNMLTMVSNGANALFYLNGELKLTGTYKALVSGNYFLGSWRDTSTQNYKGYLSDARIYATALSVDDVKSLYQNCAYIDSSGNVYGTIHES